VPALARQAAESLRAAGVTNVTVREADGARGAAGDAPFDVIVLSGSVARVPADLIDQLKPGGRLLAVVGDLPMMVAQRITRLPNGGLHTEPLFDTVAPRLVGFSDSPRFQF
jgi:protein-L-isoaspartate(D-aspartate) O-methyltransferase